MAHNNKNERDGEEASGAFEKIMGTLTVGLIFRHFVSGAVFVASFYFAQDPQEAIATMSKVIKSNAGGVGVTALLCGTLIYSLHRSISNPILEVLRHSVLWFTGLYYVKWLRCVIMPPPVKKLMFARWSAGKEYRPTPAHISSWGDYVHLQYTTAIAILLGSYAAYYLGKSHAGWNPSCDLLWIFGIFLVSGFYTDCRKHAVELGCYEMRVPDYEI